MTDLTLPHLLATDVVPGSSAPKYEPARGAVLGDGLPGAAAQVVPLARVVDPLTGAESLGAAVAFPGVYGPAATAVALLKSPGVADYVPERAMSNGGDEQPSDPSAVDLAGTIAHPLLYDGSVAWNRARSASQAVVSGKSSFGGQLTASPGEWSVTAAPAAPAVATATRAAAVPPPGAGAAVNVCRSITACLASAALNAPIQVVLRDGAAGVGAIIWRGAMALGAGGSASLVATDLNIVGTPGNAMTLETLTGAAAGAVLTLAMTGYVAA